MSKVISHRFNHLISDELNQKKIVHPYVTEYLSKTEFRSVMGSSKNSVIWMVAKSGKGDGDNLVFPKRRSGNAKIAVGDERLEASFNKSDGKWDNGTGAGEVETLADTMTLTRLRFTTEIEARDMTELQTGEDLMSRVKEDLVQQAEKLLTEKIVKAFLQSFLSDAPVGQREAYSVMSSNKFLKFRYSDLSALFGSVPLDNMDKGKSRARILIGSPNSAQSYTKCETLEEAFYIIANRLSTVDKFKHSDIGKSDYSSEEFDRNTDSLTVNHIRQLYNQAFTGQGVEHDESDFNMEESSIEPFESDENRGVHMSQNFILFINQKAYNKLLEDPEWQDQVKRGAIERVSQPSVLHGCQYKGNIEGVAIIVSKELSKVKINYQYNQKSIDNNSDISQQKKETSIHQNFAISFLCGASAQVMGLGGEVKFTTNSFKDYESIEGVAHNEISAVKVLKYKSSNAKLNFLVENAVVTSITAI